MPLTTVKRGGKPSRASGEGGTKLEPVPDLPLGRIDLCLGLLLSAGALFFYMQCDVWIWKNLYLPGDQFSSSDPAGSSVYHKLLSGEGVIRDRRDVLSVTFEYPELDESLLVDPVIRWALDGVVMKCGASATMNVSIYLDDQPLVIHSASTLEGESISEDVGSVMSLPVLLTEKMSLRYNLAADGGLTEGPHDVILHITFGFSEEIDLRQWGCAHRSCSVVASRVLYFVSLDDSPAQAAPVRNRPNEPSDAGEAGAVDKKRNIFGSAKRERREEQPPAQEAPSALTPGVTQGGRRDKFGAFTDEKDVQITSPGNGHVMSAAETELRVQVYLSSRASKLLHAQNERLLMVYFQHNDDPPIDITDLVSEQTRSSNPDELIFPFFLDLKGLTSPGIQRFKLELFVTDRDSAWPDGEPSLLAWDVLRVLKQ